MVSSDTIRAGAKKSPDILRAIRAIVDSLKIFLRFQPVDLLVLLLRQMSLHPLLAGI